jgi:phospholipase C
MNAWRVGRSMCAVAASAALAACGRTPMPPTSAFSNQDARFSSSSTPIRHIIVMVQENRTFNDLFATFPGALGTTTGKMRVGKGKNAETETVQLRKMALEDHLDLNHIYPAYRKAYRDGNMDGFNLIPDVRTGKKEGRLPYQYVDPAQVQPYWTLAQQYALADHIFQTQGSGSFTAHQDLIAGATAINAHASLIDYPQGQPWGCDAPQATTTSLITTHLVYERGKGPFPCLSYETLQALLDAKSVSWKYYTPGVGGPGSLWNAFLAIAAVYDDKSEWAAHIASPETKIFDDISNGTLPAMSWLVPDSQNSDHPGSASDTGPSWVASVVNAVGESSYWKSTAVVILWDDWGGFYDPVKPPKLDNQGGPGFRVPMIVVSPYVPKNEISHTVYEFGSILRFVEDTWELGRLGTTDVTSTSIADIFSFGKSPRRFQKIPSQYSRSFFIHHKPSGLPVDTQ